jgi:uroporphyrinogen-III synthase
MTHLPSPILDLPLALHTLHTSLIGKRIVVTRPRAQSAEFCRTLAALGAQPISFPTVAIAPMDDYGALDQAIATLDHYHWIIFTSANGVAAFWSRSGRSGLPCKVAAIGPATAQALEGRGLRVDFVPDEYVAEAIVEGLGDVTGQRILLPRADLAVELERRGALVHSVPAYRTVPAAPDPYGLAELRRGVDAITFTSSSTVRNFVALFSGGARYIDSAAARRLGHDGAPMPSLGRAAIACIGPVTAQTAREAGLPVDVIARREAYTADGLIAALADYFSYPERQLKENRWTPRRVRVPSR